jgi:hypothetical protein
MLAKNLNLSDKLRKTLGEWNDGITVSLTDSGKEYTVSGDDRLTEHDKLIRVTDVLGIIDKFALRTWAMNMALDYVRNNLFETIRKKENPPSQVLESVLQDAALAHENKRDTAATFGSDAHDLLQRLAIDPNAYVDKKFDTVVNSWRQFMSDSKLEIIGTEISFYHHTLDISFAGTADLVAIDPDGNIVIADYKTGARLYPETCLQLSAYVMGLDFCIGNKIKKFDPNYYRNVRALAIRLPKTEDDSIEIKEVKNIPYHKEEFIHAYKLKAWQSFRNKWAR